MSFYSNFFSEVKVRLDDVSPEALEALCDVLRDVR
jgi:hypothetical protein